MDTADLSGLDLELFGDFRAKFQGRLLADLTSSKQQALLAWLLLFAGAPQARKRIAFQFWPESDEAQALTNLRRELHHLRQALPDADEHLEVTPQTLRWRTSAPYRCDVAEFRSALAQAEAEPDPAGKLVHLERAAQLYRGPLLPSCYDAWLEPEREALHQAALRALGQLAAALEERRDYDKASQHVQRLLSLEPLHEASYARLMRLKALKGDRAGALHAYHACVGMMKNELGALPSPELQQQYQQLMEVDLSALNAPVAPANLPLVGRREAWRTLLDSWHQAAAGRARLTVISGEAGIGKTRLAEALLEWARPQGISVARSRSYAAEGRLAYAPVSEWLRSGTLHSALDKLEPLWLSEVARLLPELLVARPELPPPEPLRESWQRQRLFEALARALLAAPQPLLLLLDDLQWCDRDSLEWLHYLLRFEPTATLLVLATLRSEEAEDNPALVSLLHELRQRGVCSDIRLGPLGPAETAALAASIIGEPLGEEAQAQLLAETEGHPLFIVETARAGFPRPAQRAARGLPPKVQAVIAARLAHLSAPARELVGLAATLGRAFSFEVLAEASDLDEAKLARALDELWQRHIVREQRGGYDFSHDRIREVAYTELSPARRRLLHKRVAQALELVRAHELDDVSAQLAAHYEQAGQTAKAVRFYAQAAQAAIQVSAGQEAVRLLQRALTLLDELPPGSERDQQELALQFALSAPLNAIYGYASSDLERALERVRQLGAQLGEEGFVAQSLVGLFGVYFVRGEIDKSCALGREALELAQRNESLRSAGHLAMAGSLTSLGELAQAHHHFEQAIAHHPGRSSSLVFGANAEVFMRAWQAHALWLRGYPEQAGRRRDEAVARAEALGHPYSLALAHAYGAITSQLLRDAACAQRHAAALKSLCDTYGFAYYGEWGEIVRGWGLAQSGAAEEGRQLVRDSLAALRAIHAESRRPYYLSLLAEIHLMIGQRHQAGAVLDAAVSTATQNRDLWWTAELQRLRGELSDGAGAEACFKAAIELAREQESRSLELRAALSLGRLWRAQGRAEEAGTLVEGVYAWFTEGFDTPDLQAARHFWMT